MIEESLDDVLPETFHSVQSGISSVVYDVVEMVMQYLLREYIIGQPLDAHIAKYFGTDEAANGLRKRLLTSASFMPPIATSVRCELDTEMEEMKDSTAVAPKRLVNFILTF